MSISVLHPRRLLAAIAFFSLLLAAANTLQAQDSAPDPAAATRLETVVVSGEQPGPGLWKVSKGDHTLWLLGTLSPLPKRMHWTSDEVEAVVARSQQVLLAPQVSMRLEGGMLRGLLLLPSAMKARNNPDAQTLSDVIPAPLYARWLRVKQRYLGRSLGIEKRRPIVAAEQLDQAALRDEGLVRDNRIEKTVRRAAKRNGVEIVSPTIEILVTDPAELLKELRVTSLDDVACLERTIARVESDLETLKLRANAWALGEVELLQRLPYTDNYRACTDALLESRLAPRAGLDDLQARVAEVWLKAVDSALTEHEQSFAMLPIGVLLREDGYLARLTERGYRVQAPQ